MELSGDIWIGAPRPKVWDGLNDAEILVRIGLGRGDVTETVWTCDFSHDYVTINADYRS